MKKIFALVMSLVTGGIIAEPASLLEQVPDSKDIALQEQSTPVSVSDTPEQRDISTTTDTSVTNASDTVINPDAQESAATTKSVDEPTTEPMVGSSAIPVENTQEQSTNLTSKKKKVDETDVNSITKPLKVSDNAEDMYQVDTPSAAVKSAENSDEIDTTILV